MEYSTLRQKLSEDGYVIIPRFFDESRILEIREQALRCFDKVAQSKGSSPNIFNLFREDREGFISTAKTVQHILRLWQLSVDPHLMHNLQMLGVKTPSICTRPVMFFNHPKLAEKPIYNSVPAHQDWPSMQGSLNALVVWLPLMDIRKEHGPIEVLPGSHKEGVRPYNIKDKFACVELSQEEEARMQSVGELNIGDIVIFHSMLVHRSGDNKSRVPRWSAHFRYNDLADEDFINRGYPCPYVYYSDYD